MKDQAKTVSRIGSCKTKWFLSQIGQEPPGWGEFVMMARCYVFYVRGHDGTRRELYSPSYFEICRSFIEKGAVMEINGHEITFREFAEVYIYPENVEPFRQMLLSIRKDWEGRKGHMAEFLQSLSHYSQFDPEPWWRVLNPKYEDYTEREEFNYQMGDAEDFASERIGKYVHPRGKSPYKDGVARGRICPETGKLLPKSQWPKGN